MKISLMSFTAAGMKLEEKLAAELAAAQAADIAVAGKAGESGAGAGAAGESEAGLIANGAGEDGENAVVASASGVSASGAERLEVSECATRYRHGMSGGIRFAQEGLDEWTARAMKECDALIFIGASGIAVRAVAPHVKDKLKDPAVLVTDEQGRFVIPLLSGHVGGANALADRIAGILGSIPVITTATDINGAFSADLFAKENHLQIANREAIAAVSTRAIEGKPVRISIEGFPPEGETDVVVTSHPAFYSPRTLVLCPKKYAVGIGCRRGTGESDLEEALMKVLENAGISIREVGAVTSIDKKADEEGLLRLTGKYRLPFLTFSAEVLRKVKGEFHGSGFVENQVGVDNVCERSALAAVGAGGELTVPKTVFPGITVAVAKTRELS